jgi:Ca-activated chloride channel family protein
MAQVASVAGVRVHAIGVGTEAGTVFQDEGFSIATALDSNELKQVASITDGTYHPATDAAGLGAISSTIHLHFTLVSQYTEVTGLFCAVALVILLLGALASMRWLGRIA